MDLEWYDTVYLSKSPSPLPSRTVTYVEPYLSTASSRLAQLAEGLKLSTIPEPIGTIRSTIITLGDHLDKDALTPGLTLATYITDEDFGQHCLEYTHPEFRNTIKSHRDFYAVVVAGN